MLNQYSLNREKPKLYGIRAVWSGSILFSHFLATFYTSAAQLYKVIEALVFFTYTVKPGLSGHLKIDKTKILMTNGSLMTVKSIAECSHGAFCNACVLH